MGPLVHTSRILYSVTLLLTAGLALVGGRAAAADEKPSSCKLTIPRVSQPPVLTDFLSMEPSDIHGMAAVTEFVQRRPDDGKPATQRTIVSFSDPPMAASLRFTVVRAGILPLCSHRSALVDRIVWGNCRVVLPRHPGALLATQPYPGGYNGYPFR